MSKWFAVAALGLAMAVVGCKSDDKDDMHDSSSSMSGEKKMMVDDCPHCAGVQHADGSGKCPACGMKVK